MVQSTVKCQIAYETHEEHGQWAYSNRYVSCDLDFVFKKYIHSSKGSPPKSQLQGGWGKGIWLFALFNLLK